MAALTLMGDYKLGKRGTRLSSVEQMGLKLFEVDARLTVRSNLILEQEFSASKTNLQLPLHLLENNLGVNIKRFEYPSAPVGIPFPSVGLSKLYRLPSPLIVGQHVRCCSVNAAALRPWQEYSTIRSDNIIVL